MTKKERRLDRIAMASWDLIEELEAYNYIAQSSTAGTYGSTTALGRLKRLLMVDLKADLEG